MTGVANDSRGADKLNQALCQQRRAKERENLSMRADALSAERRER